MQAPTPNQLSETKATEADLQKMLTDWFCALRSGCPETCGGSNSNVQVQSAMKQVPKPDVKLFFTVEVHGGAKDVCKETCRGSVMSNSNNGRIISHEGHQIY